MSIKFGAYGLLWTAKLTRDELFILEKCKSMGFDGIEVPMLSHMISSLPIADLKRASREIGIQYACSTGLDRNTSIISDDLKIRRKGIEFLKQCIDSAADLGSDVLAGVVYAPWAVLSGAWRTQEEINRCVESLKEVAEHAAKQRVALALEPVNRYEGYFLNTAEQGLELIRQVASPYIRLQLDTFQMNIEEASMYDAIRSVGKDLYHFHVCASHRGIPGKDLIDWQKVFQGLKDIHYDRWMVIESFAPDNPEIARNVSIWRQLAPSSDAIAREGLEFLKRNLA